MPTLITKSALTFSDVLIVPQYSEVMSRSKVDTLSNMGKFELQIPVISANMKDITGPKMCIAMAELGAMGILHRFMNIEDNVSAVKDIKSALQKVGKLNNIVSYSFGVSVGIKDNEKERFSALLNDAGAMIFCLDVAHGDHVQVKKMIKYMKDNSISGSIIIIAGNIATKDAAKRLVDWGCDIVKVGIGPGCFISGTKVLTKNGYKNIENIEVGDYVLTHRLRFMKVVATTNRKEENRIFSINGTKCTENHEFYVLNKKYKGIVNDDNIDEYAEWKRADELTKDYILLKK